MRASAVDVIRLSLIAKHNLDAELIGTGKHNFDAELGTGGMGSDVMGGHGVVEGAAMMHRAGADTLSHTHTHKKNMHTNTHIMTGGGGGGGGGGGTADEAHGDGDPTGDPTGDTRDTQQQQVYGGSDIVTAVGVGDDVQLNTTDAEIDFEEKEQGRCIFEWVGGCGWVYVWMCM